MPRDTEAKDTEVKDQTGVVFTNTFPSKVDEIVLSYLDKPDITRFLEDETFEGQRVRWQFYVKNPAPKILEQTEQTLLASLRDCRQKLVTHKVLPALTLDAKSEQKEPNSYSDLYSAYQGSFQKAVEILCTYDAERIKEMEQMVSDVVFHFCRNNPDEAGTLLAKTLPHNKPRIVSFLIRYGANLEMSVDNDVAGVKFLFPTRDYQGQSFTSLFLAVRYNYPAECVQSMIDHGAPLIVKTYRQKYYKYYNDQEVLLYVATLNCSEATVQAIMRHASDEAIEEVNTSLNNLILGKQNREWCVMIDITGLGVREIVQAKSKLMDAKESLAQKKYTFTSDDITVFLTVANRNLQVSSVSECMNVYDHFHLDRDPFIQALVWGSSKYAIPDKPKDFKKPDESYTGFRIHIIDSLRCAALAPSVISKGVMSIDDLLNNYERMMKHDLFAAVHDRHGVRDVRIQLILNWQNEAMKIIIRLPQTSQIKDLAQYHQICLRVLTHDLFAANQEGVNPSFKEQLAARIRETEEFLPKIRPSIR